MTIVEKAAYLKGLADGLGLDPESKEGKLWTVLNDLLGDMAHEIEDLQSSNLDMAEVIDDISEDLSYLEELTCDLDTPPCPPPFPPMPGPMDKPMPEHWDGDFGFGFDCSGNCDACGMDCPGEEEDGEFPKPIQFPSFDDDDFSELIYDGEEYELTCPTCGAELVVSEEQLQQGSMVCPECGEELEFEFDEDDEDGEDE